MTDKDIEYNPSEKQKLNRAKTNETITWFANGMRNKLAKCQHKGSWDAVSISYLLERLLDENEELIKAVSEHPHTKSVFGIIDECHDVANFAMMIADNCKNGLCAHCKEYPVASGALCTKCDHLMSDRN